MTTLTLSKWGNAQGVRIPKDLREQVGMTDGCQIDASIQDGGIMLKPIHDTVRVIQVPRLSRVFTPKGDELL